MSENNKEQKSAQQDEHSGKGISIWLEDLRRAHEYLDAGKPFFTGKDCAELADLLESLARSTKAAQQDEREALSDDAILDISSRFIPNADKRARDSQIIDFARAVLHASAAQQVQADAGAVALLKRVAYYHHYYGSRILPAPLMDEVDAFLAHTSPAAESDKRADAGAADQCFDCNAPLRKGQVCSCATTYQTSREAFDAHCRKHGVAPDAILWSVWQESRTDYRAAMSREQSGGDRG